MTGDGRFQVVFTSETVTTDMSDPEESDPEPADAEPDSADEETVDATGLLGAVPESVSVPETVEAELRERVEADPETTARAVAGLAAEYEELAEALEEANERADDLESRLARKQAEFRNYKKRKQRELDEQKERATEALVERLVEVRDDLARALDQDEDVDIRDGIERTLEKFDRELDRENVERIEPAVGDTTDPSRHEVLATVAGDQPEGRIVGVHRSGYEMAGKVLRPAQVTVSDGSLAESENPNGASEDGDETDDGSTSSDELETNGAGE